MNFNEFYGTWKKLYLDADLLKNLRVGQSAFNRLSMHKTKLAQALLITDNDPFYLDKNIDNFWKYVSENWDNPEFDSTIIKGK